MYAHLYFFKNTVFFKKKAKWLYVNLSRRDLNSCYRETFATQVLSAARCICSSRFSNIEIHLIWLLQFHQPKNTHGLMCWPRKVFLGSSQTWSVESRWSLATLRYMVTSQTAKFLNLSVSSLINIYNNLFDWKIQVLPKK